MGKLNKIGYAKYKRAQFKCAAIAKNSQALNVPTQSLARVSPGCRRLVNQLALGNVINGIQGHSYTMNKSTLYKDSMEMNFLLEQNKSKANDFF